MTSLPNDETESGLANVLLVDDREEDLAMTRIALFKRPKLRCNLHTARDGREAYDFLTTAGQGAGLRIDLILLDINMPDVNGFEVLEQIQANDELRHITTVMCSGSDYEPDQRRALQLGAAGYLVKPPSFAQLKVIIERHAPLIFRKDGQWTCLSGPTDRRIAPGLAV